jgi:hypothetical protein
MLYNIRRGIRNIIRWLPIIWKDEDFDWYFLAKIMEAKTRYMSEYFKDSGIAVSSIDDAKELLICSELLKRLMEDEFNGKAYKDQDDNATYHQRLLGNIIGRKLRCWWD